MNDIYNKKRKNHVKVPQEQIQLWFSAVDEDKNEKVSYDEVVKFLSDSKGSFIIDLLK